MPFCFSIAHYGWVVKKIPNSEFRIPNLIKLSYGLYCIAVLEFPDLTEGEEALCVRETDESACGKVEVYLFEINFKATVGEAGEELGQLYLVVLTEDILHVKDAGFTLALGHSFKLGEGVGVGKAEAGRRGTLKCFHTSPTAKARADVGTEGADIGTL